MSLALVAIVLAIGAGAVVAVSTREPAAAAIGLAVALVASGLLADPLPSAAILGVRIVAGLLAAALIRWAARGGPRQFSPIGWPAEALLATAGAIGGAGLSVGLASVSGTGGQDVPLLTSAALTSAALTTAAGTSLLVLGAAPLVHGRAGFRRAVGLVLVTQAVLLLRLGIAGPASELEEITRAALLVAAAGGGSALARAATVAHREHRAHRADEDADEKPAADVLADGAGNEPDPGARSGVAAPRRSVHPR